MVRRLEMVESLGAPPSGHHDWSDRSGGSQGGGSPSRSPTRNPTGMGGGPPSALAHTSLGDAGIPDRMPSADELTSIRWGTPPQTVLHPLTPCRPARDSKV